MLGRTTFSLSFCVACAALLAPQSAWSKKPAAAARGPARAATKAAAKKRAAAPRPAVLHPAAAKKAHSAATPAAAGKPAAMEAPVLDLSEPAALPLDSKDRQELLSGKKAAAKGGIDFGGDFSGEGLGASGAADGSFDFGADQAPLDLGDLAAQSGEQKRFESAMVMMSSEDYSRAALEFHFFKGDKAFAAFAEESEFQQAKALYRLGLYEAALVSFETILQRGPRHHRYKKSVEWLFFMSRKLADQTPVLAQLAKYRNVTFPKAYRNEYHYLLAKYLFTQAEQFEVTRLRDEELQRSKRSPSAGMDFAAMGPAASGGESSAAAAGGMDFGAGPAAEAQASGLDFGSSEPRHATAPPATAREALKQGLEQLAQVDPNSTFSPRSRYLQGLMHYLGGDDAKAVTAFLEGVRTLNPKTALRADPKLRELGFLSLARLHYGYKQFNRAVFYYDLIDRDSENWLTSLFEASWAYYRRGDFEKALGNLLTLHSPFFEKEYFPESYLVKAIIYFEACRYTEARQIIDEFMRRYTAVLTEIQKIARANLSPEALLAQITAQEKQREPSAAQDTSARVRNLTFASADIRQAREVLEQVRAQRQLLLRQPKEFVQSDLGGDIGKLLQEADALRTAAAGTAIVQRFEQEEYKLKGLLAQALRIKIEVARSERDLMEKQMQKVATHEELVPPTLRTVTDDEHLFWPYTGEYWRDELGTYELDFSMCQQSEAP